MLQLTFLICALVGLNFLSNTLNKKLFGIIYVLTKKRNLSTYIFSLLFFPGTFLHEAAHFLTALILLVPVGDMELVPKIEEGRIKLGQVAIAKTDPIRRFVIGMAPFIWGVFILVTMTYLWSAGVIGGYIWGNTLYFYVLFQVANTMFTSREDMRGAIEFFAILVIFIFAVFLTGIVDRMLLSVDGEFLTGLLSAVGLTNLLLMAPIVLDVIIILVIVLLERLLGFKISIVNNKR